MFNLIWNFAKTKAITIFSKIDVKELLKNQSNKTIKEVPKLQKGIDNEKNYKKIKEPKWQTFFPFSFFYGNNKFQPLYFFITLFCFLAASMLYVKIYGAWKAIKAGTFTPDMISTADLATVLTFASSLVILYNSNKKNKIEEIKNVQDNKEAN
jgi:hypothetical protein